MNGTTRRIRRLGSVALAVCVGALGSAVAGELEPSGPPAPTLLRIPTTVARTGQTTCWNTAGNPVACAGTGQDAAIQAGVSVGPRFTDNGNGTVKDNQTGLVWLKSAACFGALAWDSALASANTLTSGACGLTDGSTAGQWRLPNVTELQSLIDYAHSGPALPAGQPFLNVQLTNYWTSTTYAPFPINAWRLNLNDGFLTHIDKNSGLNVWVVRNGQ